MVRSHFLSALESAAEGLETDLSHITDRFRRLDPRQRFCPAIYAALTEWLDAFIRTEDVRVEVVEPSTLEITVVYLIRATNERRFLNVEVTE